MDKSEDAILRWPFYWALGLFILPVLIFTNDFGLVLVFLAIILMPYVSLPVVLVCLWAIFKATAVAWRAGRSNAWKRCVSALVLPLLVVMGLLNGRLVWSFWETSGEGIRFQTEKPGYWEKINQLNPDDGPRLAVFPWGGWAGLGERVMVYDESDEILLEESKRSAAWKKRSERTDLVCRFVAVPHEGHFYKAYLDC